MLFAYEGTRPTIADDAFVAPTATIIGDVTIEPGASVWYGAVLRGDDRRRRVGEADPGTQLGGEAVDKQGLGAAHAAAHDDEVRGAREFGAQRSPPREPRRLLHDHDVRRG